MTASITFPETLAHELADRANDPRETAGVLLVGIARQAGQLCLLARELHWVPDDQYDIREQNRLSIRSGGYVKALARAEEIGATAVWLHTHPQGWPENSIYDDAVDAELSEVFPVRTGQTFYASLVFSPSDDGLFTFSGRVYDGDDVTPISRAWVPGSRLRLVSATITPPAERISPQSTGISKREFHGSCAASSSNPLRVSMPGCFRRSGGSVPGCHVGVLAFHSGTSN